MSTFVLKVLVKLCPEHKKAGSTSHMLPEGQVKCSTTNAVLMFNGGKAEFRAKDNDHATRITNEACAHWENIGEVSAQLYRQVHVIDPETDKN